MLRNFKERFSAITSCYLLLPPIPTGRTQNALFTTKEGQNFVFAILITCRYEYWRENSIIPKRHLNAEFFGSIASGGASRPERLVGGLSDPLSTFRSLSPLTCEVSVHLGHLQVRAECDICLPLRYLKLKKPARKCLTSWSEEP